MANKNNKNLTWRDVWKLPFHIDTPDYCLYIFDKTGNTMVLSYSGPKFGPHIQTTKDICEILNGNEDIKINSLRLFKNLTGISVNGFNYLIRGWGELISTGGQNLDMKEAAKIQDEFTDWIYNTLKQHLSKYNK